MWDHLQVDDSFVFVPLVGECFKERYLKAARCTPHLWASEAGVPGRISSEQDEVVRILCWFGHGRLDCPNGTVSTDS